MPTDQNQRESTAVEAIKPLEDTLPSNTSDSPGDFEDLLNLDPKEVESIQVLPSKS